jgi:hypothetical protein
LRPLEGPSRPVAPARLASLCGGSIDAWLSSGHPFSQCATRTAPVASSTAACSVPRRLGLTSTAAAVLGLFVVRAGAGLPGVVLLAGAVVVGLRARHWLSLAGRSAVGARSEDEVRRALEPLRESGWRLRHGLRWHGGGDIDWVAIAPSGLGFAIETKTRTYDERHVDRVREQAGWLGRRRRRWCRRGALPVLCAVRATGMERY